jgi:hypothetical protein
MAVIITKPHEIDFDQAVKVTQKVIWSFLLHDGHPTHDKYSLGKVTFQMASKLMSTVLPHPAIFKQSKNLYEIAFSIYCMGLLVIQNMEKCIQCSNTYLLEISFKINHLVLFVKRLSFRDIEI